VLLLVVVLVLVLDFLFLLSGVNGIEDENEEE